MCQPLGYLYERREEQCSCGKGCTSSYPCVQVLIAYKQYADLLHISRNISTTLILHETETTLHRQVSAGLHFIENVNFKKIKGCGALSMGIVPISKLHL